MLRWLRENPGLAALIAVAVGANVVILRYTLLCRALGRRRLTLWQGININTSPYQMTNDDVLQLARSAWGEAGSTNVAGMTAVLWALANHYMRVPVKRTLYPTLGAFVRQYSTPLHAGRTASSIAWADLPLLVRETTERWAAGCVPDLIMGRTDWRAVGTGYVPADAFSVGGNTFGTNEQAVSGTVRIS